MYYPHLAQPTPPLLKKQAASYIILFFWVSDKGEFTTVAYVMRGRKRISTTKMALA